MSDVPKKRSRDWGLVAFWSLLAYFLSCIPVSFAVAWFCRHVHGGFSWIMMIYWPIGGLFSLIGD